MEADLLRIPVGPGAIHVDRYGHGGAPVILIHGFGTSSFLWRRVGPRLARLGHTAFALDLFGYGESDRPWDADFGIAAQAEYLDRALTALRAGHPTVVGVGIGGAVALRLAATRPERVARLVLVNTPALDLVPGREIRTLQARTARFPLRISRSVLGAAPLLTPLLRDSVGDPAAMPDRLVARYLAPFVGRDGLRQLLTLARSIRATDMTELELGDVQAPTLVVWGDRDRYLEPDVADQLVAGITGARLERFPDAGRLVPEEHPDELAELIHAFAATPLPGATGARTTPPATTAVTHAAPAATSGAGRDGDGAAADAARGRGDDAP
ncbi:MAG TPA: alpha/beta hydrolase [Gemmatimonadaceae bacterium]|nr:alpha/beta hydrolase [Gemmatimonadaceae bacterium]